MRYPFPAFLVLIFLFTSGFNFNPLSGRTQVLEPVNGGLKIPLARISDGNAHHFKVKADDGTMVTFFVLKSRDEGYYQDGDFMVCENCGMRFASTRINVVKGGCNPAPLNREVRGDFLAISMKDINANKWYMKYRRK
jgi:uncharacterized membrane protein